MKTALHENASVPVRRRDFCRSRLSGCELACGIAWMVCRTEFPCSRCALFARPQNIRGVLPRQWLAPRAAKALHAHGIRTLADLTMRIPCRRRWWAAIDGLGVAAARHIEAFFAAYPQLTERARALIVVAQSGNIVPWEQLCLPHEVDGSQGAFRAPWHACTLNATNGLRGSTGMAGNA